MCSRPRGLAGAAGVALLFGLGCAGFGGLVPGMGSLRLTDVALEGDPERRSSMQLVLQGLDDDADRRGGPALSSYQNALRVDPSNPYAYLALARQHVYGPQPDRAFAYLDQCRSLLHAQGAWSPGVEAHVEGLRGAALAAEGREREAGPHLERARRLDPWTWGDGYLAAGELR